MAANGLPLRNFIIPAAAVLVPPPNWTLPHQAGIGFMMSDRGVDGYRGDLNKTSVTIASSQTSRL